MKKRILLLTTGGTIASLPTDRGLSPGLNGTALAGLLPQGVLELSLIHIWNSVNHVQDRWEAWKPGRQLRWSHPWDTTLDLLVFRCV